MIIRGKVKFILEDKEYLLEDGDSVYFNSKKPHKWKNVGKKKAIIILVIPAQ
ncbi:MAG TPA: hypothetical protein DHU69_06840 [Deltaproteobacteria bacterium]|nr:hypothetical protein [Deltaproteobacteria bacterium]